MATKCCLVLQMLGVAQETMGCRGGQKRLEEGTALSKAREKGQVLTQRGREESPRVREHGGER